jgi:alpha-tubulin suppressor-like RCC1 family protein
MLRAMRHPLVPAPEAPLVRRIASALLALLLGVLAGTRAAEASTRTGLRSPTAHAAAAVRVAAGDGHTCQVQEDGTVRCWGRNDQGQLGDGSTSWTGAPVTVAGLTQVVAVAAGFAHSCALLADGSVRCWGNNGAGQLGDGSITPRPTPVAVSGLSAVVAISAGDFHTCALLASGGVLCWGRNVYGELGNGTTLPSAVPVAVKDLSFRIVAIAAGGGHTCALSVFKQALCWGRNDRGQVGNGSTSHATSPVMVFGGFAVSITAGGAHTCVVYTLPNLTTQDSGELRCWGAGTSGQLGDGLLRDQTRAVAVAGLTRPAAVVAGRQHTCALLADGSARCWGDNGSGQLGHADGAVSATPAPVAGLSLAAALAAGARHTCAVLADGHVRCWGRNADGEQGNGLRNRSTAASIVLSSGGSVMARGVAAGGHHSCALRANGSVACWGRNDFGQVGYGGFDPQPLPVAVAGLGSVLAVAAGGRHSCALVADGSVRCWGANDRGQLGDGTLTAQAVPVAVVGVSQAIAITAGEDHGCALLASWRARCWGANGSGQLGDGSLIDRPTAVPVASSLVMSALAAGASRSCALSLNYLGSVAVDCWGTDSKGRLVLAPDTAYYYGDKVDLAAGGAHACALTVWGRVECWGLDDVGQLGTDPTVSTEIPSLVSGLDGAIGIAIGRAHSCAGRVDGTARCWGDNSSGQLGDTTTTQRNTPAIVSFPLLKRSVGLTTYASAPLTQIVQLAAGGQHSCLLRANGAVNCTGDNGFGQLGLGTSTPVAYPAPVPSFTLNIDPAVALPHGARVATVTLLAACSAGQELRFDLTLRQDGALGQRRGTVPCGDGLARLPITLPAQGPTGFGEGAGLVEAVADIVERGLVVDTQRWSRRVQLRPGP